MNLFLKTEKEIVEWLEKYAIKNYTLLPDSQYGFKVNVGPQVKLLTDPLETGKAKVINNIKNTINLSKKGLSYIPVKFGKVECSLICYDNQLTNLDFAPDWVAGDFVCSHNLLTCLKGCPQTQGNLSVNNNQLTSLKGSPEKVMSFNCSNNQLKSLENGPQIVKGALIIDNNQLTTLDYLPQVSSNITCSNNQLKSFKGLPNIVHGLRIHMNKIESFEGCPEIIVGDFFCGNNQIKSFKYAPKEIKGNFYANFNEFENFNDFETHFGGDLRVTQLKDLQLWELLSPYIEQKSLRINYENFKSIKDILENKIYFEKELQPKDELGTYKKKI